MVIISGKYRGKKLLEYSDNTTRPTIGRVRESIFNVLSNHVDFMDARVLDLFAGTGAYGLECHSRGASLVVFNDTSVEAIKTIKTNAKSINCAAVILNLDYEAALEKLEREKSHYNFDIVFLDPPYNSDFGERAIKRINLAEKAVIVFETEKSGLEFPADYVVKVKNYGRVFVYFLIKQKIN